MSEAFEKSAAEVKNLRTEPSDEQKLKLYGYYKQATVGDVSTDRPGLFDLKGKAKWDAWKKVEGMAKADSQSNYCKLVEELVSEIGLKGIPFIEL